MFARGIHRCNFKHPLLLDTVTSKAGLANRKRGGGGEEVRGRRKEAQKKWVASPVKTWTKGAVNKSLVSWWPNTSYAGACSSPTTPYVQVLNLTLLNINYYNFFRYENGRWEDTRGEVYPLLSTIRIGADTLPYPLGKPRTRETFLGSSSEVDQE